MDGQVTISTQEYMDLVQRATTNELVFDRMMQNAKDIDLLRNQLWELKAEVDRLKHKGA